MGELSLQQRAALEQLHEQYLLERHRLQKDVFEAAVRAMCHDYSLEGNDHPHVRYAEAVFGLVQMHDRTVENMAAILEAEDAVLFRQRFTDIFLKAALSNDMTVHAMIVAGLVDPEVYRPNMWDQEEHMHRQFRPEWDRPLNSGSRRHRC